MITLAVTTPAVQQKNVRSVTTIVETIIETVKSFWRWFASWSKKIFTRTKVVETTTVITITTPKVKRPEKAYCLALADPANDTFYMSICQIDETIATAVMTAIPIDCIGKTDYQMILSVFTKNHSDAATIMNVVGYGPRTPYDAPELEKGLYHYYSLAYAFIYTPNCKNDAKRSPHMFFINLV